MLVMVNCASPCQALFLRRSLVLTELAHAYPIPATRKVDHPKHGKQEQKRVNLLALGARLFALLARRLCIWVAIKLSYLKPLPSKHNRRYLRKRLGIP